MKGGRAGNAGEGGDGGELGDTTHGFEEDGCAVEDGTAVSAALQVSVLCVFMRPGGSGSETLATMPALSRMLLVDLRILLTGSSRSDTRRCIPAHPRP